MSQHDFNLANQSGAAFRGDANNALEALATLSSGASAPSTAFPYQWWADTTNGLLKQRNAANSAWIVRKTLAETFVVSRGSNSILGVADFARAFVATAVFTQTLTAAATLGDGWGCAYRNGSTGDVTLDPNGAETIDGAATLILSPGESCWIYCNGTAFFTFGRSPSAIKPGMIVDYAGAGTPEGGYLECDGAAVSRSTYARLFADISTTWGAGDGSTTFNVPDLRDRSTIGAGTGTNVVSGLNADVDTATDGFTVPSNIDKWVTGMPVTFTLTSGTITGLTSGNPYFVVRSSSTLIKLASTLANAQAGTVIDLTAKSTPVWTITQTLNARTLGQTGGQDDHAMSSTELLAHTHTAHLVNSGVDSTGGASSIVYTSSGSTVFTGSSGGNAAANVKNPYAVVRKFIKT